ncbi:MAG: endopeptidase La [Lachnospiraceae bacterium]|nr:endopeptidase La [Lachnospiraceae bacterium]
MENKEIRMWEVMPAVALRGLTIFPRMIIHFDLSRQKSIIAVEQAMMQEQKLFVVTQRDSSVEAPGKEELYRVGTVAAIKQVSKLPGGLVRVLVEGISRGKLMELESLSLNLPEDEFLQAHVQTIEEAPVREMLEEIPIEEEAMLRQIKDMVAQYSLLHPKIGKGLSSQTDRSNQLPQLLDQLAVNMPLSYDKKQMILESLDLEDRYEEMVRILAKEIEVGKLKNKLSEVVKGKVEENQKEFLLREQLKFIRKELGEDGEASEIEQFEAAVEKLEATEEVKEKIKKEIQRFKKLSSHSSEYAVERGVIETLLDLPWDKIGEDNLDLEAAEEQLNRDHYGLEQVKERILEFLAVRALLGKGSSSILCLVGPPGTGKTSIARSVAEALNKKYVRICLGGVRDEAEIRGHRRTYVGAMPGRIAQGLRHAGVKNPLMLLDEIDKVSNDYKGDTFSALLEVLDSEQNSHFRDHYVEIPIDLSQVFFICTANTTNTIPRPLLDRMEVIEVTSYTSNEKFHIAKKHLVEKQLKANGMKEGQLIFSDGAIKDIIRFYTREAGVRTLERTIGSVCRKAAREILKEQDQTISIGSGNLGKYLGKKKYTQDKINKKNEVGIVRGLAWTSVGGDTLQIEVNMMPGKGKIELTGQLGDVMKESAHTAVSYVRSISKEYEVEPKIFTENDFHIHIPQGAVPKDGPSAGITMATALLSAVIGHKVRADVAMTGEVTLRGRVLPIGGLKEKILAAKVAGVKTVLVPKENRKDVEEITKEIKSGLEIIFVEHMKEVLEHALVKG